MELPGIPSDLLGTVQAAARNCGVRRLALVGGAVRDGLLHHAHRDPWRGLTDLDLVVEGSAEALGEALRQRCGAERVPELRVHGAYGTVELLLDGVLLDHCHDHTDPANKSCRYVTVQTTSYPPNTTYTEFRG